MKVKKNTPPGWLERQAKKIIEKQGYFLLAYDVVKSEYYIEKYGYNGLADEIESFHKKMNEKYAKYFIGKPMGKMPPKHEPRILFGFTRIKGDAGVVFLRSFEPIRKIVTDAIHHLPFHVRWMTACDEWDKKLKSFI